MIVCGHCAAHGNFGETANTKSGSDFCHCASLGSKPFCHKMPRFTSCSSLSICHPSHIHLLSCLAYAIPSLAEIGCSITGSIREWNVDTVMYYYTANSSLCGIRDSSTDFWPRAAGGGSGYARAVVRPPQVSHSRNSKSRALSPESESEKTRCAHSPHWVGLLI
jgi:hypothetical protein